MQAAVAAERHEVGTVGQAPLAGNVTYPKLFPEARGRWLVIQQLRAATLQAVPPVSVLRAVSLLCCCV